MHHYVTTSKKNWLDLLDTAQFCYNLHKSSSMGFSPFELATRQHPLTPQDMDLQRTGGPCPFAYRFACNKHEMLAKARDILTKASRRMKKYADQHRQALEFEVGNKVIFKLTPQI